MSIPIPKPISLQTREEIIRVIDILLSDQTGEQKLIVANDGNTYLNTEILAFLNTGIKDSRFDSKIANRTLISILENKKFAEIIKCGVIQKDDPNRDEILSLFESPISHDIMSSPFIIPSGSSYEQCDIKRSIAHKPTDPLTRQPLHLENLIPNKALLDLIAVYAEIDSKVLDNIRERLKIAEEEILRAEKEIKAITKSLTITTIKLAIFGIVILADYLLLISLALINRQLFGGEVTTMIGELVLFIAPVTAGTLCLLNHEKAREYIKNLNIKKQEKIAFVESSRPILEFEKRVTDALLAKAAASSSTIIPVESSPLDSGAGVSLVKNTEGQRFFGKICAADISALQPDVPTEASPLLASSQISRKP